MGWTGLALLSALFAGLTALLAKIGVRDVPSNVATLVRTLVVVAFAAAIVQARGETAGLKELTARNWTFLALSGIATGCSWLCYFAALQRGNVAQVAPIDKLSFVIAMVLGVVVLGERVKPVTWVGAGLILVGVMLTLDTVQDGIARAFHGTPAPRTAAPARRAR